MLQRLIICALMAASAFLLGVTSAVGSYDSMFAYTLFTLFWGFVFMRIHNQGTKA